MIEQRGIVHMGGSPGSGKSRLASALTSSLEARNGIVAEHVSLGNRLRHIGRGVIESMYHQRILDHLTDPRFATAPLDTEMVQNILLDALQDSNRKDVDIVLLDGFPRYPEQIESLQFLSIITGRSLMGSITTVIDRETALARIIKRSQNHVDRKIDYENAERKLDNYYEHEPPTIHALETILPVNSMHYVTSSGSPVETAELGYRALMNIIHNHQAPESLH